MQLALTCQSLCDFIFNTDKGMVIDRAEFDECLEQIKRKGTTLTIYLITLF